MFRRNVESVHFIQPRDMGVHKIYSMEKTRNPLHSVTDVTDCLVGMYGKFPKVSARISLRRCGFRGQSVASLMVESLSGSQKNCVK